MLSSEYPILTHALQLIQQSLHDCLQDVPLLFWQLDPVRNKLRFFSEPVLQTLGLDVPRLFQNDEYLDSIVLEEDRAALREALNEIRMQKLTGVFFRIRDADGCPRWLTMMGMPTQEAPYTYMGVIGRCNRLLRRVTGAQKGLPPESMEWLTSPMLMASFTDWRVTQANRAARELCGRGENTPLSTMFVLSESIKSSIYESLTFYRRWQGVLQVRRSDGSTLPCSVLMRPLAQEDRHYLWILLTPLIGIESAIHAPRQETLELDLSQAGSVPDMLNHLLEEARVLPAAEGIILSHIFPEENRVKVTSAGGMFPHALLFNEYPYVGSIAENIVRFGLDSLTVDDTARSIRPIDWALFIPQGVRSYYAEPWFEDGNIRMVLIFCASRSGAFSRVRAASLQDVVSAVAGKVKELDVPLLHRPQI